MLERLADRLGLNAIPQIFFVSAGLAIGFVACAIPFSAQFAGFFGALTEAKIEDKKQCDDPMKEHRGAGIANGLVCHIGFMGHDDAT